MESLAPYREYLAAVPRGLLRRLPRPVGYRIDFASNDYCDAARNPAFAAAAARAARRYGNGSTGSRLLSGVQPIHALFERRIANDVGADTALLFASGWQANVAVVSALLGAAPGDSARVYCDRLMHASLHDAVALAGLRQTRFRHNDADDLERRLAAQAPGTRAFIITESLFGMDGDLVDAARIFALAARYDAICIIDEAHATGVCGSRGYGLAEEFGRNGDGKLDQRIVVLGTLSKALGSIGGYAAVSETIAAYLIQACRGFMFATSPAPAQLAAAWAAWRAIRGAASARAELGKRATSFRRELQSRGYSTGASETHIIPIQIGDVEKAVRLRDGLAQCGIAVSLVRPPTVPPNGTRLRVALRTGHSDADIREFFAAFDALRS